MSTPVDITAVIARPNGAGWSGRYVRSYGAPTDLGPLLHRLAHDAHVASGQYGIEELTRTLIETHYGWNRIEPDGERLGDCRCHEPEVPTPSWPDDEPMLPGRCATARYAYILTATGLQVLVRINGDWNNLGRAAYTRETARVRFDLMVERARQLNAAHLGDTDSLN
ncbi:hypothetical protein KDK95_30275 [Actinospica sp. MGRD01-02]|uniref:Uncharacterized protein n=1 Tax=Actinospica acidithermotolerans TaxID=2828514 RepID=A0A941EFT5_9ACTN|nr:hypothetical protein [Actinospica acidithermotolerans]MBR7830627.1 hypothetical protein [Actinospica acidithermotolerans]